MISYLVNFTNLQESIIGKEKILLGIAIILILPGFYFEGGSFIMNTIGLSIVNIGFGIIILTSMNYIQVKQSVSQLIKRPINILAFIGQNSYSIYLWHLTALSLADFIYMKDKQLNFLLYFILSIVIGIVLSYTIEKPFLKLRDIIAK